MKEPRIPANEVMRHQALCSLEILDTDASDNYGYPLGDRVIKSLARLLSHRLRKGDVAARSGGEEVAIILPDTPPEAARKMLDNLRQRFSEIPFGHADGEFTADFSAGIAACSPQQEMQALITAADGALYRAKQAGRNQVVVDAGVSVSGKPTSGVVPRK